MRKLHQFLKMLKTGKVFCCFSTLQTYTPYIESVGSLLWSAVTYTLWDQTITAGDTSWSAAQFHNDQA